MQLQNLILWSLRNNAWNGMQMGNFKMWCRLMWKVQGMLYVLRKDKRAEPEGVMKSFLEWLTAPKVEEFSLEITCSGCILCTGKMRMRKHHSSHRNIIIYGKVLGWKIAGELCQSIIFLTPFKVKHVNSPLVTIRSCMNSSEF